MRECAIFEEIRDEVEFILYKLESEILTLDIFEVGTDLWGVRCKKVTILCFLNVFCSDIIFRIIFHGQVTVF